MRRQRGFTLIELLVAVVVLALLAELGWRGLDSVARSRDAARGLQQQTVQLQQALQQLQIDLQQACDAGPGLPALSQASNGDLLIVRRAGPDASLQLVRWGLRASRWQRWAGPLTGSRADLLAARARPAGPPLILLDQVRAVALQVYRPDGSDWNPRPGIWAALPPVVELGGSAMPAPMANLPTPPALRLSLTLANPAFAGLLTRDFLLENRL